KPAEDLEDAPIFIDDYSESIPDLEAMEIGEDIELFTETELDLKGRLSQVEDEQLELAAGIGAERARWQKRVAALSADMTGRNRQLAEREQEIEDLTARLAMLAVERDGFVDELRELQRSFGQAEVLEDRRAPSPADGIIASLHERLRERSQALLVARQEIDRLRADREQLIASIADRDEFIQRLHERLPELEGSGQAGGELRKLMRRFFGGEEKVVTPTPAEPEVMAPGDAASTAQMPIVGMINLETPAGETTTLTEAASDLTVELPRQQVLVEDMQQAPPRVEVPVSPRSEPQVRRYLIGLDMVGSVFEMTLPRVNVGRTRDNDLRIVDPTVSRLHAVLKLRGNEVSVIDANSLNGVFVNGIQLRYAKLEDGDTLTFGSVRFRYRVGSGSSGGAYGPD
ncbi:MAG: FHA domain-containing protein, partial [Gammaproteobacteria bacterium]|nr:FHA domain-containing protein [Gammaproteobacteria bacterium]